MLTLHDEQEDHYADFLDTLRFLFGSGGEETVQEVERLLIRFRSELYEPTEAGDRIRCELQELLRSVMTRTERVSASRDRDAMLVERPVLTWPVTADLRQAKAVDAVARAVGAQDAVEYWKSAPYLFNFMKGYDLKRRLNGYVGDDGLPAELQKALQALGPHLLNRSLVQDCEAVEPANARLRALLEHVLADEQWRLLWVPPALSYTVPVGSYADARFTTKSLVFSSWNVVPDALAALASYEAERRRVMAAGFRDYFALHREKKALLVFKRTEGRLDSMTTLLLLYPSPTLASAFDPLRLALDASRERHRRQWRRR
jgi:hypothetical protein